MTSLTHKSSGTVPPTKALLVPLLGDLLDNRNAEQVILLSPSYEIRKLLRKFFYEIKL